jgi:hypothetical protein
MRRSQIIGTTTLGTSLQERVAAGSRAGCHVRARARRGTVPRASRGSPSARWTIRRAHERRRPADAAFGRVDVLAGLECRSNLHVRQTPLPHDRVARAEPACRRCRPDGHASRRTWPAPTSDAPVRLYGAPAATTRSSESAAARRESQPSQSRWSTSMKRAVALASRAAVVAKRGHADAWLRDDRAPSDRASPSSRPWSRCRPRRFPAAQPGTGPPRSPRAGGQIAGAIAHGHDDRHRRLNGGTPRSLCLHRLLRHHGELSR